MFKGYLGKKEERCSGIYKKRKMQILFILLFFLGTFIFGQENQTDKDKKLKEDILAVYKSKGEEGLRNFVKDKRSSIEIKFIVELAESGVKGKNEELLNISLIIAEEKKDKKTLADVYYSMGKYFRSISNGKKALDYFNQALPIYVSINDFIGQGNVYLRKGVIYYHSGDNQKSLEMYRKALPLFEKAEDSLGQGNIYMTIGDNYLRTGNNLRALEVFEKALPFFKKVGNSLGQANIYKRKGDVYFYTGDNFSALGMYDKALLFYEKASSPIGQGIAYLNKGKIYFYIGDNFSALEMYNKALFFFKKSDFLLGQGNVYLGLGEIYLRTGESNKALEMYKKALTFYEKVGDPVGQGNVYLKSGEYYFRTGDKSNALIMYDKALVFFGKVGNPLSQGNVFLRKGELYLNTGNSHSAIKMFDKALSFYKKGESPIGQGNVYWNKGDIYFINGSYSKSVEMYDKALLFYEKARDIVGAGNVRLRKGEIYSRLGDNLRALELLDDALPLYEKSGQLLGQGNVWRCKGNIHLNTGDNKRALEMYDKAFTLYLKIGEIEMAAYTLHGKARALAKQGKKSEAVILFEESIFNLEKLRRKTPISEMKMTFMEKTYGRYEDAVIFILENMYYERGLKYAESMKARVFLDWLAEGLVRLEKGIALQLKQKRDNLTSRLSILSKEMNEAVGKNDEIKLKELKEQYRKVEGEFEELLVKIRLQNPMYASVRYPEPVSLQELQKNVLKKKELLLRYFIAKDKAYVFVISKKAFNVVTLAVKPDHIDQMVKQYVASIEKGKSADIIKYGTELYRKVFKPLEAWIKNKKNIIIVPDGELAKIPFESFIIHRKKSGKPVYLLEKYRLKYTQSASVLAILRKHYRREGVTNHFTGFGDPVYDYENFKKGKPEQGSPSPLKGDAVSDIFRSRYKGEGGILKRLQASGEEVKTIAGLFKNKAQKSVVYLREKANESNAKSPDLKTFDYIHFSCHGILGNGFQSLVLSQIPGSPEDGYLTLNEIMNCDYNAKLVVLSACQTGKGKMERGEGVTGLTRAVMHAGTPAVVASLWNVADVAAKELMVRFYRYMLEKKLDKNEALRKAKLDLIKSEKYASPFFWSAFVMYGE